MLHLMLPRKTSIGFDHMLTAKNVENTRVGYTDTHQPTKNAASKKGDKRGGLKIGDSSEPNELHVPIGRLRLDKKRQYQQIWVIDEDQALDKIAELKAS